MNIYLLGAGLLALLLGLGGWLLWRRRSRAPLSQAGSQPAPPATGTPVTPMAGSATAAGASAEAQRQAATEALRLARQRKAQEAARLAAQRQAEALREAQARVAQPPPVAAARPRLPEPSPPPAAVALPPRPAPRAEGPPTVLLADDSKVVRVKTGRLLEKQGWKVLLADDGLAALQLLEREAPDLLITDVEMPGLDGFALTRRLRADARWRRLPVIMITSSDERHRDEARAAGVDLLLGKPYAEEALLAQVQRLLGSRAGLAVH